MASASSLWTVNRSPAGALVCVDFVHVLEHAEELFVGHDAGELTAHVGGYGEFAVAVRPGAAPTR
jgi:hypothetical protein